MRATASPPTQLPAQYSPALVSGTTRFGMGRGGIDTALGHAHRPPPYPSGVTGPLHPRRRTAPREHPVMTRDIATDCAGPFAPVPSGPEPGRSSPRRSGRPTTHTSALDHEHGFAPVGYPPSTCRLATGWSARGLTSFE